MWYCHMQCAGVCGCRCDELIWICLAFPNVIGCSTTEEQLSTATAVRDYVMSVDVSTAPQIKRYIDCRSRFMCKSDFVMV